MSISTMSKSRIIANTAAPATGDNIASYLVDAAGTLLTSTLVSGKQSLDVNVTQMPAITLDFTYDYAEDAAHTTGDVGAFMLAVRKDAAGSLVGADGDYAPFQVNASGYLRTVDADLAALVTNSNNLLTDLKDVVKGEDTAHVTGHLGSFSLAVRRDADTSSVDTDGDYAPFLVDALGNLKVNVKSSALPTGASTEATLALAYGELQTIDTATSLLSSTVYDSSVKTWDGANTSLVTTLVTAGLTQAALPASALANRRTVTVQNNGTKAIYIGPTGVTASGTTKGIEIAAGSTFQGNIGASIALFVISGTAGQEVVVAEMK